MSHANGKVLFLKDNHIMYYEYDGTTDTLLSCLYENYAEMLKKWRNQPRNTCTCGKSEDVEIANDYGFGYWHKGLACRYCKAFVSGVF